MMNLTIRKIFPSHPVTLGFLTAVAIALNLVVSVILSPRFKNALSPEAKLITQLEIAFALFFYGLLIALVVLLLRRKLFLSMCYLAAFAATYASCLAVASLNDNRLVFPSRSHREIADIYQRREVDFDATNRTPHRVFLDEQCHPPNGCGCWVLMDPDHRSGVENDVGGWRRPTSPMLPLDLLPVRFAIVHVRALDSSAYSVLGCGIGVEPPLIPH
ncbi:MAG: hypothetical protein QOJ86_2214 [Bradyrhizobium sp.]|nr:hypothetical protein [Bradyrhizobium sp.]